MIDTRSFSLIEVLVFTCIVSIFFIVAVAVATVTLRTARVNQHKILATHAGEELMEWLKGERETDWTTLSARSGTFCFNGDLRSTWSETMTFPKNNSGACVNPNLYTGVGDESPLIFKRELVLTPLSSNQSDVVISVSWLELGVSYIIPIQSRFSLWE